MKVVGQSTLADGAPYVHLAYVSATTVRPEFGLFNPGIVVLSLGACALVVRGIAARTRRFGGLWFKVRWALWNWVLIAVGFALVVIAYQVGDVRHVQPKRHTESQADEILDAIVHSEGAWQPRDMSDVQARLGTRILSDGWFGVFRLDRTVEGNTIRYALVSAGPDGQFGTSDDISRTVSMPLTRPVSTQPAADR